MVYWFSRVTIKYHILRDLKQQEGSLSQAGGQKSGDQKSGDPSVSRAKVVD